MTTFEIIKKLCSDRKISINDLENELGYSKNTLYRLKTQNPGSDKLEKIADYFNVSTDYLLGRNVPEWATTDDVVALDGMLERNKTMSYNGENLTEEEKDTVRNVLEGIYWKKMAEKRKKELK